MKALFAPLIGRVLVLVRSVGPYAAIELLLPGGSMVALLYWWYRHRVNSLDDKRPRVTLPYFLLLESITIFSFTRASFLSPQCGPSLRGSG
jgi:hypothetical protein